MFGLHSLTKTQRLILGIFVLLIVDFIWVASSELTEYLFKNQNYDKPFFTTYSKTSLFTIYLIGFVFWQPWRQQCRTNHIKIVPALNTPEAVTVEPTDSEKLLSDPVYVPIKFDDKTNGSESDDSGHAAIANDNRSVRFNRVSEVRQLSETYAEEAVIARLSYSASLRAEEARLRAMSKLNVKQVAKLSFIFCILWFFGNYFYQMALQDTEAAIVNVLSSTSGLFTLICAAIYPSSSADRFTLSKLVTVGISIGGMTMISLSDLSIEKSSIPIGCLWALGGAMVYALYLVMLRRRVDHEDKLDIPMFFGFVGLFNVILLWPGFIILHYSETETFEWPNKEQLVLIVINGIVGTVISELLWLWGCFLTSSLIGTLSLSLTIPLTMMTDVAMKNIHYNWLFYIGCVPVFLSFFGVTFLTHYESWDPVLIALRKLKNCICRKRQFYRIREADHEQSESLIGSGNSHHIQ